MPPAALWFLTQFLMVLAGLWVPNTPQNQPIPILLGSREFFVCTEGILCLCLFSEVSSCLNILLIIFFPASLPAFPELGHILALGTWWPLHPTPWACRRVWSLQSFLVWTLFLLGWTLMSDYFSQCICDRLQVSSACTGRLSSLAARLQLPKSKLGDMNMQINASKLIAALLPPRGSKLG